MLTNLFDASFEQSQQLVKKSILDNGAAKAGSMASSRFSKRLIGFVLMTAVFGTLAFTFAVIMPEHIAFVKASDVRAISVESAHLIGKIGVALKPVFIFCFALYLLVGLFNLLPAKNYPRRLAYGSVHIFTFMLLAMVTALPFAIGLAIDGSGVLGTLIQLVVGIYLISELAKEKKQDCLDILNKVPPKRLYEQEGVFTRNKKILIISAVFVFIAIINRLTFNIGPFLPTKASPLGFVYAWSLILIIIILGFALTSPIKGYLETYYFNKYAEEYYDLFEKRDGERISK